MTIVEQEAALALRSRLQLRAQIMIKIRAFMHQHHVLEVETPVLVRAPAGPLTLAGECYQLSAEPDQSLLALLTAGSGDVFRIGKVFRDDAKSRKHWPEFSVASWWRQGDLAQQMTMLVELVAAICNSEPFPQQQRSYRQAFIQRLELDPVSADINTLQQAAQRLGLRQRCGADRQAWLDLLFKQFIEPTLGYDQPLFITGLPAALKPAARTLVAEPQLSESFDLYIDGLKLASGQQIPVTCAGSPEPAPYSGVTLGLDRLAMLLADVRRIEQVLVLPG